MFHFLQCHSLFEVGIRSIFYERLHIALEPYEVSRWHILVNCCLYCCCMHREKEIECELSLITLGACFIFWQCHSLFEVGIRSIFYERLHIALEPYEVSRWTNHLQMIAGPKNQIPNKQSLIESKNRHWA